MRTFPSCVALLVCCLATGCGELALQQKERQMELVARDWAMTIRASQVVPVYPLSQDMQPGDVFLVNRTVADQSARYTDRGFLPTDLRLTRLFPDGYAEFYSGRDDVGVDHAGGGLVLPRDWRDQPAPDGPWDRFPKVGFPSYSFEVSNSGGLSIAIPVQAVPLGLSVTGAARATGSVTMSDAVTYGIDASSMYESLREAAASGALDYAVPPEGQGPWYLRVVTRVFGAKSFNVVLRASSVEGGGVDAGQPQPVEDPRDRLPDGTGEDAPAPGDDPAGQLENGQSVEDINRQLSNIGKVTDAAGRMLPGGSVRATFANFRTVGFEETFVEPLIVGYHGFDVAIDSNGNLGPIVPTFQVLADKVKPLAPTGVTEDDSSYLAIIAMLREASVERATDALTLAAGNDGALSEAFGSALAETPRNPVGAWTRATRSLATDVVFKRRLSGWLSRAVRETAE